MSDITNSEHSSTTRYGALPDGQDPVRDTIRARGVNFGSSSSFREGWGIANGYVSIDVRRYTDHEAIDDFDAAELEREEVERELDEDGYRTGLIFHHCGDYLDFLSNLCEAGDHAFEGELIQREAEQAEAAVKAVADAAAALKDVLSARRP